LGFTTGMLLQAEFGILVARAKEDTSIDDGAEQVRAKFGSMFTPAGISELDAKKFKEFLTCHWRHISRHSGEVTADLPLLRKAILILVDEGKDKPISERIDEAKNMIQGLGRAAISAILLVAYPTKYGVYNSVSEKGLRLIGMHPKDNGVPEFNRLSTGKQYEHVNRVLQDLSTQYGISQWALDRIWGKPWNPR
jgi:hypothetical protein